MSVTLELNPRTKLAALVWAASFVLLLPPLASWGFAGLVLAVVWGISPQLGPRLLRRVLEVTLPFSAAVLLVQTIFLRHPDAEPLYGPLNFSRIGFERGLSLSGRVTSVVVLSLATLLSTPPASLLRALDAAGWPPALAYLIASPLLILESFKARVQAIRHAQQTRGWRLGGSPLKRLRGVFLLISPLITTALIEADQRSHVLAQRGFRAFPRRTTLLPVPDAAWQHWVRLALVSLSFVQLGVVSWIWLQSKI
ncbi:energy-coupling factor transporter transmembrane component T [Oryzibacter oryziterrae]|uniref:energy-coupling factor transporter transmembrane component T n=1 Tax=Oryzibacter oryziterrae TaxID=2766474 RepID=UPI001F44987F|nr:energy-coupling factor transporter transmembrane component T [Oryzibacter oryziterrae]